MCVSPRKPIWRPIIMSFARRMRCKQLYDSTVSAYREALELTRDSYKAGVGSR